jgi:hypothetical protein
MAITDRVIADLTYGYRPVQMRSPQLALRHTEDSSSLAAVDGRCF